MSGGSLDYVCWKIEEQAKHLGDMELIDLAMDMAKVFHDAEWWISCDIDKSDYLKTVQEFKQKWFGEPREKRVISYINKIFDEARQECIDLVGVQS